MPISDTNGPQLGAILGSVAASALDHTNAKVTGCGIRLSVTEQGWPGARLRATYRRWLPPPTSTSPRSTRQIELPRGISAG